MAKTDTKPDFNVFIISNIMYHLLIPICFENFNAEEVHIIKAVPFKMSHSLHFASLPPLLEQPYTSRTISILYIYILMEQPTPSVF